MVLLIQTYKKYKNKQKTNVFYFLLNKICEFCSLSKQLLDQLYKCIYVYIYYKS